jgi:N-acetylneuraminate lyase
MRFPLRLTGLVAAPHTPMHADGSVNPKAIAAQAQLLLESGVRGAFIGGTTGESLSLTAVERMSVTEAWLEAAGKKMPIVVHVGCNSLPEARALARHAARYHASAIAVMAPNFFKPTLDDLIGFCAAVGEAAPDLPMYYYDIPTMTNVLVSTARFLEQGAKSIPTLHGIKFTNNDLMTLQECLSLDGFDIVFGYDELLLAGLCLGVRGAVGSTYNFAAPLYLGILDAFERGDLASARTAQRQSVRLIRVLQDFGFSRASKAMMRLIGVDCGPVRLPLRTMAEEEVRELWKRLHGMEGFSRPLGEPGR